MSCDTEGIRLFFYFIFRIIFIFYLHIFVYILSAEPVNTYSTRSSVKCVFLSDNSIFETSIRKKKNQKKNPNRTFTSLTESGHLHCEFVSLLFFQDHRETVTDRFLATTGVQISQTNVHFRRPAFSSQFKSKVGHIPTKTVALRIVLCNPFLLSTPLNYVRDRFFQYYTQLYLLFML